MVSALFRRGDVGLLDFGIWMAEEAEREFDPQYPAHRLVDHRLGQLPGADQPGQARPVKIALHIHVDAGGNRLERGDRFGFGDPVIDQFAHRIVIAIDESAESPFLAEDPFQQEGIRRRGDAVERA